ncbi:MAG: outer membrane beta-barrel protein [Saprospiraceae bacterium]
MPAPGRNDGPLPPDNAWRWGFSSGVNFSKITDIKPVIVGLNTAAVTKENYKRGFVGSVFLFKRFEDSYVAFQPELQYSCQGGDFDYKDSDTIAPLTSKMRFNYQYINFLPLIKIYPFFQSQGFAAGIHFGLAPQLGFNVTHSKIRYTSAPDPTFDLDISAALGRMLKGRTDVQAVFELGYDYFWEDKDVCFSVNGRYNVGIKDMIETQANGFGFPEIDGPGFMEVDNFSRHFQVTLGVSFLLVQQ